MKKLILTTALLFFCDESYAEKITEKTKQRNYYVKSGGYSSTPEPEPPYYAKQLDKTGIAEFKNLNWVEAGLNYRARFEHRDGDYRRSVDRVDNPLLSRTQFYFGIKEIIDPLRFAIELQDSRRNNSEFSKNVREVNELNLFQAYGELYFKNPLGFDREVKIRAGRMAFELMDRKLISRDDWGNSGTNFQGFRAIIGKKEDSWQLDNFAMQPIRKSAEEFDQRNSQQWIYGSVLSLRQFSQYITLQPFYLKLTQEKSVATTRRNIDSPGLRFYGTFLDDHFDYGIIGVYQFGEDNGLDHRAYAYSTEFGYKFLEAVWQPRLSLIYGYASGDKNPRDGKNQRFERFYGFNRPWSNNNHIDWTNLQAVKSRVEIKPTQKFFFESSYSYYWLASSTDLWTRTNLRDQTGMSGNFMGTDWEFRAHYQINSHLRSTLGYARFWPGKFTKLTSGRNDPSDFLYFELTANLFAI